VNQEFRVVNISKIGPYTLIAANFRQASLPLPIPSDLNVGEAATTLVSGAPLANDNGLLALYDADGKLVSGHTLYTELPKPAAFNASAGYAQVLDVIEAGSDALLALVSARRMNQGQLSGDDGVPQQATPPAFRVRSLEPMAMPETVPTFHRGSYAAGKLATTSDNLIVLEGQRMGATIRWTPKHTLLQRGTRNSAEELYGFRLARRVESGAENIYLTGQTTCDTDVLMSDSPTPLLTFPASFVRGSTPPVAPFTQCVFVSNLTTRKQALVITGSGADQSFNGWSWPRTPSEKLQVSVAFDSRLDGKTFFSDNTAQGTVALGGLRSVDPILSQVYRVDRDVVSPEQTNVTDLDTSRLFPQPIPKAYTNFYYLRAGLGSKRVEVNAVTLPESDSLGVTAGGTAILVPAGKSRGVVVQDALGTAAVTLLLPQDDVCRMQGTIAVEEATLFSGACAGSAILQTVGKGNTIAVGAGLDNHVAFELLRDGTPKWVYGVSGDGRLPLGGEVNTLHAVGAAVWMAGELAVKQSLVANLRSGDSLAQPESTTSVLVSAGLDAGPDSAVDAAANTTPRRFVYLARILR
jgi:hypothetical protein